MPKGKTLQVKDVKESSRKIPSDIKMEQAVLCCILNGSDEVKTQIIAKLDSLDFYDEPNRIIYENIMSLYSNSSSIDFMTVYDLLLTDNKLNQIGGLDYLNTIRSCVPSYVNYTRYCDAVKRDSVLRKVIEMSQKITEFAINSNDKDKCLEYAEKMVFDLAQVEGKSDFITMKDAADEAFENIIQIYQNKGQIRGLMTGYFGLDKLTNGFQENDLVLLAARPSVGKTSFAMNIVSNAAKNNKKVAVFSLEMTAEQLARRMICSDSAVNMSKVNSGNIGAVEIEKIMTATEELRKRNVFIYDNSNVTAADVMARCKELKKKVGLDFIMIDYLQLMSGTPSRNSDGNRQQEIAEITRGLKRTAMTLKVPILLLSQLSRAVETRVGHRPQLSDLRESGAIEQDADIVLFLHNPSRYDDIKLTDEQIARKEKGLYDIELIVAKHRNGELKTINLLFRSENTTFLSVDGDSNVSSLWDSAPPERQKEVLDPNLMATEEEAREFINIEQEN